MITCSNSAPRWQADGALSPRSPGGLVPMLVTLLQEHGGDWVFTAPSDTTTVDGEPILVSSGISLHPVRVPEQMGRQHYELVSTRLLLWLFHYLLDTSQQPTFDDELAKAWAGYEAVNEAHARRLRALVEDSPDELILVNDHHLFLVPGFLTERGQPRHSRLAFFQGIPWCEPEYFGILPDWIRDRIMNSLLRCDVVGFHARRWAEAFLGCCERFVAGVEVTARTVRFHGHETVVAVTPFPLDTDVVDRMRSEPATERWQRMLSRLAGGRRLIVRAERLDLWKNLPRGLAAYQTLLESRPQLADEWWFCAVVTPVSRTTERSREYQSICQTMVGRINDRFGRGDREAATMVFPDPGGGSRNCAVAALAGSDVTLVNPTFDGLNLVAKEALYLAERAPLVLSINAGVYEQLARHVIGVHPFDVRGTAAALAAAMEQADDAGRPGGSAGRPGTSAAGTLLREERAATWLAALVNM
jgi:trehalose 6-phosphate synthase